MATVSVKERPILFSGEMVKAILDGRKTQTRRVMKQQPEGRYDSRRGVVAGFDFDGPLWWSRGGINGLPRCPYGKPGDRLWVRETWRTGCALDKKSPRQIEAAALDAGYSRAWGPVKYDADNATSNCNCLRDFGGEWGKTRVSIHMPRWASRITLEIAEVRVQRLQDISEEDAIAEGIKPAAGGRITTTEMFSSLWFEINGRDSWAANPFVWAITFRKV